MTSTCTDPHSLWPHPNYWCTDELAFYFLFIKDSLETHRKLIGSVSVICQKTKIKTKWELLLFVRRSLTRRRKRCCCVSTHEHGGVSSSSSSWFYPRIHSASSSVAFKVHKHPHFASCMISVAVCCVLNEHCGWALLRISGRLPYKRRRPELLTSVQVSVV